MTISQEAAFSRGELLAYQDVLDAIRTETSYVGEKVAEAESRGIKQGREEGRRDEKLTIAKNLLAVLDDEAIAEMTGLSCADVFALRSIWQK